MAPLLAAPAMSASVSDSLATSEAPTAFPAISDEPTELAARSAENNESSTTSPLRLSRRRSRRSPPSLWRGPRGERLVEHAVAVDRADGDVVRADRVGRIGTS